MFCVGTSGWSYAHWQGVFYPEGLPAQRRLDFYAGEFGCTELNASFYRSPKEATIRRWAQRVPEHFFFCIKMHRRITHQFRLRMEREQLARVMDPFFPWLADRLGPFLVQLPPNLAFDAGTAERFFGLLREYPIRSRFALEARHPEWFTPEALELAERYGIGMVVADSGGRFPGTEAVTAPFVYLRFHGPNGNYAAPYPAAALAEWAGKIRGWLGRGLEVWAFFNNDLGGHAVSNARELRTLVQGE